MSTDSALARALARIDELEAQLNAERAKRREAERRLADKGKDGAIERIVENSMPIARTEQAQESTTVQRAGKLFDARHIPMCATCNGTERVVEGGRQIDCPVCT